ncbi:MAG TPA: hypothetical protein VK608_00300 [Edaphobacter sp.]|nr:hypothetical protein [Edaphobacter sp.]
MIERRSILIHGLGLTLRRLPALLWTYLFNLSLALLFSIGLHLQLSSILNHSLASQRLISGFDLGAVAETVLHLTEGPTGAATASHASIPAYLLLYFLLVPGTLFCYQTSTPARLGTLLQQGLLYFWRFFRITLLTLVVAAIILVPLIALQNLWATHIDTYHVGRPAFLLTLAGYLPIFLVASLIRLYFDLVEVYTVQLGQHLRSYGKPDRRVRRTLSPALRTLRHNLARAWLTFLFLTLAGAAAVVLTARIAMHMLAQPHVWPLFLFAQAGLFLMLFTRFWQRGAETSLVLQNPIPSPNVQDTYSPPPKHPTWSPDIQPSSHPADLPRNHTAMSDRTAVGNHVEMIYTMDPLNPIYPAPLSPDDHFTPPLFDPTPVQAPDPIPNPEPAPPSLDEPDPGVFHHDPVKPPR